MKNILLTNHMLRDYTGSELDVCSMGTALVQKGYRVEAATYNLGAPLQEEYRNSGIIFTDLTKMPLVLKEYDLLIGHHNTIFMDCLFREDAFYKKVIFSSLSPWVPVEQPPACAKDLTLCMANSSETYIKMKSLGIKEEHIVVFPNYILPEFFANCRENRMLLKKICVISNHVAEEVKKAVEIFRENDVEADIWGMEYQSASVTPELLNQYDVVITIGKTVQYCFGCKVPVYCYDIHGGPGWLTKDNFAIAANHNFSGRGFDRKVTGMEIVMDIIKGFPQAFLYLELFHAIGKERYDLHANLGKLLDKIEQLPVWDREAFMRKYKKYKKYKKGG